MKTKIRRQALGQGGIDPLLRVANNERGGRWFAVLILDAQGDGLRGQTIEEDISLTAETKVLRPLPHIKSDAPLAFAGVPAVKLNDPVIKRQPGKLCAQRLPIEHLQIEPAL